MLGKNLRGQNSDHGRQSFLKDVPSHCGSWNTIRWGNSLIRWECPKKYQKSPDLAAVAQLERNQQTNHHRTQTSKCLFSFCSRQNILFCWLHWSNYFCLPHIIQSHKNIWFWPHPNIMYWEEEDGISSPDMMRRFSGTVKEPKSNLARCKSIYS